MFIKAKFKIKEGKGKMTVGELKEILDSFDDDYKVVISNDRLYDDGLYIATEAESSGKIVIIESDYEDKIDEDD